MSEFYSIFHKSEVILRNALDGIATLFVAQWNIKTNNKYTLRKKDKNFLILTVSRIGVGRTIDLLNEATKKYLKGEEDDKFATTQARRAWEEFKIKANEVLPEQMGSILSLPLEFHIEQKASSFTHCSWITD